MTMMSSSNNNNGSPSQFGDTTLTKVFVGGLAWETPKDTLREHFEKYGDILEAVIIYDKVTGRSKGYGFVTFKEAEAAKKACEETSVIINGRRANCNIASLGARRPRSSPPSPSPPPNTQGGTKIHRSNQQQVQWYYPVAVGTPTPPSPIFHHHHHALPFYGFQPTYIATDHMNYNYNYNQKLNYGMSGGYVYSPRQAIVGAMPIMYHHPAPFYRSTEAMAPQIFHPTHHYAPSITPTTGPVGTGECFKRVVV